MRRREFLAGLGSAVARPATTRAQRAAIPVIGVLASFAFTPVWRARIAALHQGLAEIGYVEGQNLVVEYRWAEDHYDRLPMLAADLVRRQVAVIVSLTNAPAAVAAQAATRSIPIVFLVGVDPVEYGLVASLARPGGNLTGFTGLTKEVMAKRLELLRELVPRAASIAYLFNPANFATEIDDVKKGALLLGLRLMMMVAKDHSEIRPAFERMAQQQADALLVSSETLFISYNDEIATLAKRYKIPSMFVTREAVEQGGLISYGGNAPELWRQAGIYVGRILNGEKPAELPVQQRTKWEMVINLKTAKALDLTIPNTLLVRADEVIE